MKRFLVAASLTVALVACGSSSSPNLGHQAPPVKIIKTKPRVIDMPAGFSDVAVVCDGPNRVYVTYDDVRAASAVAVVKDSEQCSI